MTIKKTLELEGIMYIAAAALVSVVYLWNANKNNLPVVLQNASQVAIPLSPAGPKVETSSQISPDGTKTLNMTLTYNRDDTLTYSFETEDTGGTNQKKIYSVIAMAPENYSIPYNAWSPDNKYVFIYKNGSNALVFNADGKEFAENNPYIELQTAFEAKNTTHKIIRATGWADPALLIFNGSDEKNNKQSFWLEVPSKAIIPLSTGFY